MPVLRLLRFLPVVIPILTAALRNPKIRSLLHLKPLTPNTTKNNKR